MPKRPMPRLERDGFSFCYRLPVSTYDRLVDLQIQKDCEGRTTIVSKIKILIALIDSEYLRRYPNGRK
jgi:hypothetical protein